MARIVMTEFVSLDGVMEEPRWTFQFDRGPAGDAFKYDELFDDYRLMVFPVILGQGKRLFPDQLTQPASLTLTGSRTSGDGVLLLTYQPAASDGSAAEPGAAS